MPRKARNTLAVASLVLLAVAFAPAALQAQTATGSLSGTVLDETGAALPGTTVTATSPSTGFSRTTTSSAAGGFLFPSLPVGTYNMAAQLQGYATVTVEGVAIVVASDRHIDITLKIATVAETLTVTAEAPLIAATPSIGTVVSQDELENLPLNGRQFANLGVLAPGTTLAYNNDPTKPGQLVIQLVGGAGRNVNYLMDGGDNTDDTIGGALQNFNLESVQEFNIQTMQYKAEYGRSSGGVLSVVTKTGTNQFSGSAYWFYRDDSLNAQTETEQQAGIDKQAYSRDQYGVSLGGPIVKDKAHFFATYEKTDRDTNYTIDTGGLFPTYDGTVVPTPFTDELVTAKVTYNISAKQYLQARYGYQKNSDIYGASPLADASNLGNVSNKYSSILAGYTAQIGADALNEFVFQYSKFDNGILPASDTYMIVYPSGFYTGQNLNTPQHTFQTKYQYKDDFSLSKTIAGQDHEFKAGVSYIDETRLGGDFTSGIPGQYTALEDRIGSPISNIDVYSGASRQSTPLKQYSVYAQDTWKITRNLTVSIGLRYDYWDMYSQLDQSSNAIWQTLHDQRTYAESYLRDFWDASSRLQNDTNNWAPRIGFSWDIKGDGGHIIRGGYGTFFDFPYINATILFPAQQVQSDYGLSYTLFDENGIRNPDGTFWQPGQPLPPGGGTATFGATEVASPTLATPYSDQLSLAYSWRVTDWLGLNIEAVSADFHDIPFRFRFNVIDATTGERRFPDFGNVRLWYGSGRAKYDGFNVGFHVRKEKFVLQGFYTYSKAEGNVLGGADEFRLTPGEAQADIGGTTLRRDQSVDPLDPLCDTCFGPLYTDARHRFTIGGVYVLPLGFTISGMFRYRSALPYLEHANCDLNGDGSNIDLAPNGGTCPASGAEMPAASSVNTGRGFDFKQLDLRIAKDFKFGGNMGIEIMAEMFNVLNSTNPARPNRFGVAAAYAGDPGQGEQRLWQLSARIHF